MTLMLADELVGCVPPPGLLAVSCLDEVTGRELAARRALLLRALDPVEADDVLAVVLALAAVVVEQHRRARLYAEYPSHPYWCKCGLRCTGLAAINHHLDRFEPDDDAHYEVATAPQRSWAY
jgi:hypothetical protein